MSLDGCQIIIRLCDTFIGACPLDAVTNVHARVPVQGSMTLSVVLMEELTPTHVWRAASKTPFLFLQTTFVRLFVDRACIITLSFEKSTFSTQIVTIYQLDISRYFTKNVERFNSIWIKTRIKQGRTVQKNLNIWKMFFPVLFSLISPHPGRTYSK